MIIDKRKLQKYYNDQDMYSYIIKEIEDKSNIRKELVESRFCWKEVIDYFDNCDKCMYIDTDYITYYVYYSELTVPISKIMKSVRQSIAVIKYYNIQKKLKIHIVTAPCKRQMPDKDDLIRTEHINGGFTSHIADIIYIIRSQEFAKVILHEIMHHSYIHNYYWNSSLINKLKTEFNISAETMLIPNEAVIELYASILYIMFLSIDYGISMNKLLERETEHAKMLSANVLHLQGSNKWTEQSNAFCYIVFKTIMLCNLQKIKKLDPEYITDFLIHHKNSCNAKKTSNKSLKIMALSDY